MINTCGFINDAKEESINTILEFVEKKKAGILKKIFVMGCLSERYMDQLKTEIPEVDEYFGVYQLPEILNSLECDYKNELIGERFLSTPDHYAYLKISEGCDRNCSFCAIPLIKGKHKSRLPKDLVNEAEKLRDAGVKELILISQDLTYYGLDIERKTMLPELVEKLANIKGLDWIRLHYTYPNGFPLELLDVISKHTNICRYIDIPLQHANDRILKSMKRGIDITQTRKLIELIRKKLPEIALRTSFIVGYPGETEEEFNELTKFIRDYRFERVGVFTYSHEEDTSAYNLKDNVPEDVKLQRADELMKIQEEISFDINQQRIGKIYKVLVDRDEGEYFIGRTEFDSPEVDNEVIIKKVNLNIVIKTGEFYYVKIITADSFELTGVPV